MDREFSYAKNEWYISANWWHCFCEIMHFMTKGVKKKSRTFVICVSFYTNNKGITHVSIYCIIYCMSLHVFLLISITMNEVFNNWYAHYLLRSPISILLIKVCMRRWPRLAQALCKMRWISPGDLARSPDCNPIENNMLIRCREVIKWDGGPINYWTLHSLWCLLKEKHGVTCNKCNDAINGNMCDSLVICVEADTNHKSARFFFHTFCPKMHDFTKTMP